MKDFIYWLTGDVLELPCLISHFYVAGGIYFLIVLHFWNGGMRVVHHDVRVFILQEAPHIMIK